jgi:adenine-specific DNA-methyltransferase
MLRSLTQKEAGAYYTPDVVAECLLAWALRSDDDRLLDPSCGDGRFISGHRNSVGIEQDPVAAKAAVARAPWALVHEGDFFSWASNTLERFECAAGNPPFIRYQSFSGPVRARALAICAGVGAKFNGLASSWAPFLVATATRLQPGGRMAFVVPAEIGHAPYAAPFGGLLASVCRRIWTANRGAAFYCHVAIPTHEVPSEKFYADPSRRVAHNMEAPIAPVFAGGRGTRDLS